MDGRLHCNYFDGFAACQLSTSRSKTFQIVYLNKANKSQSQIRRLDLQIDKFQLTVARSRQPSLADFGTTEAAKDGHQRESRKSLKVELRAVIFL